MSSDMKKYNALMNIITGSRILSQCFLSAEEINLPNWWIVGGAIRDIVWSKLTGRDMTHTIRDIDLIYFDSNRASEVIDRNLETYLGAVSGIKWSVKNQARMHVFEGLPQYGNIEDAVSYFPETISGIIVKSKSGGRPIIFNMYGLSDLFDLKLRPTPNYLDLHSHKAFEDRAIRKGWLKKWPEAEIVRD